MKSQIMQHRRQIVDNLEKELWIWRAKCRADGKNISKRLVQARAKWAFHNQGIVDFKVSLCTSQNLILLGNQLIRPENICSYKNRFQFKCEKWQHRFFSFFVIKNQIKNDKPQKRAKMI